MTTPTWFRRNGPTARRTKVRSAKATRKAEAQQAGTAGAAVCRRPLQGEQTIAQKIGQQSDTCKSLCPIRPGSGPFVRSITATEAHNEKHE